MPPFFAPAARLRHKPRTTRRGLVGTVDEAHARGARRVGPPPRLGRQPLPERPSSGYSARPIEAVSGAPRDEAAPSTASATRAARDAAPARTGSGAISQ